MDNQEKPANVEIVNRLIMNMHLTLESLLKELFADLRLKEVLKRDDLHGFSAEEKEYVEKVLRVHSNLCYANLCLCVQMRSSFKARLTVEKQFNIRRSVGTLHELYKYLYGFTQKQSLWQEIEYSLQKKYPTECQAIDDAALLFQRQYAQVEDETLRDITKHFSDDPTEFFRNMEKISERSVTERVATASAYLQQLHLLLIKELKDHFGICYDIAIEYPIPNQNFDITGINKEKIEALEPTLLKYSVIANHIVAQLNNLQEVCKNFDIDVAQNRHWKDLSINNVGLHILYIYIDSMVTFRAFIASESYVEIRQNLAYLIVSAHEGFKKLYGFDPSKRSASFWNRAIKTVILQKGDEKAKHEVKMLEKRLDTIAQSPMLRDEDMVVAFSHIGTIKKQKNESAFLVLDYFRQPISKDEMNVLTDFLLVMNDILVLYNQMMVWENKQIKQETDNMFSGYIDKIDDFENKVKEKTQDPEAIAKCEEMTDMLREMIWKIHNMFS